MPLPVYKKYTDDESRAKLYQDRIESAKAHQEEWKPKAVEMIQRYAMRHQGRRDVKGHRIRSTTALGVLDSMFSNLTAVDIEFLLDNLANGTPLQAKIAQKAVQDIWNEQKVKKKSDKQVKDAALVGIGFTKTFFDYFETEKDVARDEDEMSADIDRLFAEAEAAGVEPPDPGQIPELIPLTKQVTEVIRERAVVEYVPWKEVLWDYNAEDWSEIRWIAHVMRVHKHDLLGDPDVMEYLGPKAKKIIDGLDADVILDEKYRQNRNQTPDDERLTVVQVWDFEAGDVCLVPLTGNVILKKNENCFAFNDDYEDRNPFVPLILRRDPENVKGISDMEVLSLLVDEEEVYRSELATFISRLKPKFLGPADAFGTAGKQAMESTEFGVYVPLEEASAQDIEAMQFPQMPSEAFQMLDRIKEEAREATGVNEFMRGLLANKRTTATEVNAVDNHSLGRHSEKLNALEEMYINIARRILWIVQRYYDEDRVLRIAGVDPEDPELGAEETIWDWSAEDIAAEMDLRVVIVPKEQPTKQSRRELAMWVLETFPMIEDVDKKEVLAWAAVEAGVPEKIVAKFLHTDAEMQVLRQKALQGMANEAQAADGVIPDPATVAGPLTAEELAAQANPGELPPELAPSE